MAKVSKLRGVENKMSISEGVLLFGYDMVAEYILQFWFKAHDILIWNIFFSLNIVQFFLPLQVLW